MFDPACKFLVESFPTDFATWLLGEPIELIELSPSELSLEPIRVDALILLQSEEVVLHIEFQTQAKPEIPFRMLDYRMRVYRRFPRKRMRQVVIYLYPTTSDLVQQTSFTIENTRHEFEVIRLWEQPTEIFLQAPGLLPLAVLSQTEDKIQVLEQVAQRIDQIPEQPTQSNLSGSTFVLAGLLLNPETIQSVLRRDLMQESSTYRLLVQEGREEGLQQGLQQGKLETLHRVILGMLSEGIDVPVIAKITGLSVEQIQQIQSIPENDRDSQKLG